MNTYYLVTCDFPSSYNHRKVIAANTFAKLAYTIERIVAWGGTIIEISLVEETE